MIFKNLHFRIPTIPERVLVGFLIGFLWLWDVLQNYISVFGPDFRTHITANLQIKATFLLYFALLVVFGIITYLIVASAINKRGSIIVDILMGALGYLGLIFLYGAALLTFYYPPTFQVPFFAGTIALINLYHWIALLFIGLSALYFIATE